MVTLVDVLGLALVASVVPAGIMIYVAWQNAQKPGAVWFAVLVIGMAGWSASYGLSLFFDTFGATVIAANIEFLFTDLAAVGWFLLAVEYVRGERLTARLPYLLFLLPVFTQLLVWTNDRHGLVRAAASVDRIGILHPTFGPWFFVHAGIDWLLTAGGILLLTREFRRSEGIHRNQTAVLIIGAVFAFGANVLYVTGFAPYEDLDLTPLAFLVTTALFGYGLFRYRLLELLPIARKTVMEQMDDAVVTLDEDNRVVDINPAASALFGVSESKAIGMHGQMLFAEYPEIADQFAETLDTEIAVVQNNEQRYFHLDISPIGAPTDVAEGRIVVLRDITELKEREEELGLLKQVLSRVLRHNIRNDVTVVKGYAEEIAEQTSGEQSALAETIVEKGGDIAERSQKAVAVERVLSSDNRQTDIELTDVLEESFSRVLRNCGNYDLEIDVPPSCRVRASDTLEVALTNVIENAVVHNDSAVPHVWVSVTCDDPVEVVVEDDGPGIPEEEITVLESHQETDLRHSSGVGLWLALLIIERSGGTLELENTAEGGRVVITLEPAEL
jgi:PAS domain S-box-containing protein